MLKLTPNITTPLLIALALAPISHGVKFTLQSEPLVIQRLEWAMFRIVSRWSKLILMLRSPVMQSGQMPSNHSHEWHGQNNIVGADITRTRYR